MTLVDTREEGSFGENWSIVPPRGRSGDEFAQTHAR